MLKKKKIWVIFLFLLVLHLFLRFSFLEPRMGFHWDQADNAWMAVRILQNHQFPLLGMVAKANSGFHIGPLYYYYITIFYLLFRLSPLASPIAAGVTSIITFFVLFFLVKKLFNVQIAFLMLFLHTVSLYIIDNDRSQWPVAFLVPLSLIIFYSLHEILIGKIKYILLLALAMGISFHAHFTAIFFPIITLFTSPFFPKKKETVLYSTIGIGIIFLFLLPLIISQTMHKQTETSNMFSYLHAYFIGFHLTRFFQIINDPFLQFSLILRISKLQFLCYFLVPLFVFLYSYAKHTRENFVLCYEIILWFLVPWIVFAMYGGEITDYYFMISRPMVLIIFSYLLFRVIQLPTVFPKLLVMIFLLYFSYTNLSDFLKEPASDYYQNRDRTLRMIKNGEHVRRFENSPQSYLYFYYKYKKKV